MTWCSNLLARWSGWYGPRGDSREITAGRDLSLIPDVALGLNVLRVMMDGRSTGSTSGACSKT